MALEIWSGCETLVSRITGTYLPSGDDTEIHRRLYSLVSCGLECLTLITNHITESLDFLSSNCDLGAEESLSNTNRWEGLIIAKPETPVKVLNAQVAAVCDFMDRDGTERWDVVELHGQGNSGSTTFLENGDVNGLSSRSVVDLDCFEVFLLWSVRANSSENIDTGRHGTLETDDDFLASAGREETADGVINV